MLHVVALIHQKSGIQLEHTGNSAVNEQFLN